MIHNSRKEKRVPFYMQAAANEIGTESHFLSRNVLDFGK